MKVTSIGINMNCILEDFKKKFNKDGFFIVRNFLGKENLHFISNADSKILNQGSEIFSICADIIE